MKPLSTTDYIWHQTREIAGAVYDEWLTLFNAIENPSPFLHPDWVKVWLQSFASNSEINILCIKDQGLTIAITLLLGNTSLKNLLPVRELYIISNNQSPRPGLIISTDMRFAVSVITRILEKHNLKWDFIRFNGVLEAESKALLESIDITKKLKLISRQTVRYASLKLSNSFEDYLANKSATFRRSLRKADNALSRLGQLDWSMTTPNSEDPDLKNCLHDFFTLDSNSWKRHSGEWLEGNPQLSAYYENLVKTLARSNCCGFFFLTLDDQPIAGIICILMKQRLYVLKSSYDERFAKLSPGTSLFHRLVEYSYKQRLTEIDFLGNAEFLNQWASQYYEFDNILISSNNFYSKSLTGARRLLRHRPEQ